MPNNTYIISESEKENAVFNLTLDKNDAIARANMELLFIKDVAGRGKPDISTCAKAAALYKQIGSQGHARALFNLGWLYGVGYVGTELPDQSARDKKAIKYYKRAAKLGHSTAMNNLGWFYQEGQAGTKLSDQSARDKKAIKYFKRAAKLGNSAAMNNLGLLYEEGRAGTELPDQELRDKKAARYYQQAAELGEISAMYNLGCLYAEGRAGTELPNQALRDKEAARYYQQAADLGESSAMNNLGLLYQNGRAGTELPDQSARDKEAIKYYKEAIKSGSIIAMSNLEGLLRYENRLPLEAKVDIAQYYAAALNFAEPIGSKAKTILQKFADSKTPHLRYWARFLLPENQRADVIRQLIAQAPAEIFACLLQDNSINLNEKNGYFDAIGKDHRSHLSQEQMSKLDLRNRVLAFRTIDRHSFFARLPREVMEMAVTIAMAELGPSKLKR